MTFVSASGSRAARFVLAGLLLALFALPLLAADPGFPLTIKDASGYSLTLNAKPKAIVSLTLATDEMLVDLVDAKRLAAIDVYAADAGISNVADFAKTFPVKLSGEKEKIIALQPDLVLVADWKEKEFVQALRDAKLPVFVFKAPNNFTELALAIDEVSALVGEPAKGKAMRARVDARLAAVSAKVKSVPADKRLSVLAWTFYGSTYAAGTNFDTLATQAGLVNIATKNGMKGWPQLSKEQVLALDPDIITMPSWSYDGKSDPAKYLADFVGDPIFAGLKAVKTKRVYIMQDKHMQPTSQYMADGVEDLAKVAYPELFK